MLRFQIDPAVLVEQQKIIETLFTNLLGQFNYWTNFESMWVSNPVQVFEQLGNNIDAWIEKVENIRKEQKKLEIAESYFVSAGIAIEFGACQSVLLSRSRQILYTFQQRFESNLREWCDEWLMTCKEHRDRCESLFKGTKLNDAIEDIFFLRQTKSNVLSWDPYLALLVRGNALLVYDRWNGVPNFEQLEIEFETLKCILDHMGKKDDSVILSIRNGLVSLCEALIVRFSTFCDEWHHEQPSAGVENPAEALTVVAKYTSMLLEIKTDIGILEKGNSLIQYSLNIPDLSVIDAEINGIGLVWDLLAEPWKELQAIECLAYDSEPAAVDCRLTTLVNNLQLMPSHIQQYDVFCKLWSKSHDCKRKNKITSTLQGKSIRERHLSKVLLTLNLSESLPRPTLGTLWNAISDKVEPLINDILVKAEGEMSLESYLSAIDYFLSSFKIDIFKYGKISLVKNCNEINSRLLEHIQGLSTLRNSCHFKAFEATVNEKEKILESLLEIIPLLEKAQNQWVYMHGIFSAHQGIQGLLPKESMRFMEIERELLSTIGKLSRVSILGELITLPRTATSLSKALDSFATIRLELKKYLEQERQICPRFYFLGDEDLLGFLGSEFSERLSSYIKKMYPGIRNLLIGAENEWLGIVSNEGESLEFEKPIDTNCESHVWLRTMEATIKTLIFKSVKETVSAPTFDYASAPNATQLSEFIIQTNGQVLSLSLRILWAIQMQKSMGTPTMMQIQSSINSAIMVLSTLSFNGNDYVSELKRDNAIKELLYQRECTRRFVKSGENANDFEWRNCLKVALQEDSIKLVIAGVDFEYGFEYFGAQEQLVRTPLTDRCFDTLALALNNGLGGSPFGPAGTGKVNIFEFRPKLLKRWQIIWGFLVLYSAAMKDLTINLWLGFSPDCVLLELGGVLTSSIDSQQIFYLLSRNRFNRSSKA